MSSKGTKGKEKVVCSGRAGRPKKREKTVDKRYEDTEHTLKTIPSQDSKSSVKSRSKKNLCLSSTSHSPKSSTKSLRDSSVELSSKHNDSQIVTVYPKVTSRAEKYTPMPYTFRLPKSAIKPGVAQSWAKSPPYHLQLDHTLAVVWSLFSNKQTPKPLGIVQLQWALNFLTGIHNRKGDHPKDIALCIQAIEEELIEGYASLVDTMKPPHICECHTPRKTESKKCFTRSRSKDGKNKPIKYESTTDMQEIPFSINYAEMSKNTPNRLEQLFKATEGKPFTDIDINELNCIKQAVASTVSGEGIECSISREKMVDFLRVWRKEQIDKIQQELRRLHSIETFIGNVDRDEFQPLIEDKQLDILLAERLNRKDSLHGSSSSVSGKSCNSSSGSCRSHSKKSRSDTKLIRKDKKIKLDQSSSCFVKKKRSKCKVRPKSSSSTLKKKRSTCSTSKKKCSKTKVTRKCSSSSLKKKGNKSKVALKCSSSSLKKKRSKTKVASKSSCLSLKEKRSRTKSRRRASTSLFKKCSKTSTTKACKCGKDKTSSSYKST